jgi:hypothetical protein
LRFAVSCGDRKRDHRRQQNMRSIHVDTSVLFESR